MHKHWLICGAILACIAVATGALGDHMIRPKLLEWFPEDADKRIMNWEVAGRYLFFHALAICVVGLLPSEVSRRGANMAGVLFLAGIVLFSGCLFGFVLTGQKWFVSLVPVGGLSFMVGWLMLAAAVLRAKHPKARQ